MSRIRANTIVNGAGTGAPNFPRGAIISGISTINAEISVGTGASISSPATNTLALGTNNTEKVRITSAGLVGIGTDNPTTLLDIRTTEGQAENLLTLAADRNNTGAEVGILFKDRNVVVGLQTAARINSSREGSAGAFSLVFHTSSTSTSPAAAERLRIGSAGQLGIGGANYGTAGQVLTSGGAAAAPSWSGGATRVLEYVSAPCNGQTVLTSHGSKTTQNAGTAGYQLTTSYALLVGSMITYRPPTGTTTVVYRYAFQCSAHDTTAIAHFKFYIGTSEVTYARYTIRANGFSDRVVFEWPIKIGGSASASIGQLASWNSDLTMKMEARDYSSSFDMKVNMTNNWDGGGTDQFSMPTISITALG